MSTQYSIKVFPAGRGRDVYRNIEICGDETLDQLCKTILDAFDFIDELLYEFCMDNRQHSTDAYYATMMEQEPSTDIALDELGLYNGQKFLLHYDFGDDWIFHIRVLNIIEVKESFEPRIIKSKGNTPIMMIGMNKIYDESKI